jgi:hypothetical protein
MISENTNQGAWGELYGADRLIIQGYEIEKTGIGSDVHAVKRDMWGNVIEDKLVDFKTGGATLSERQKECGAEEFNVWVPPFARHFSAPWSR